MRTMRMQNYRIVRLILCIACMVIGAVCGDVGSHMSSVDQIQQLPSTIDQSSIQELLRFLLAAVNDLREDNVRLRNGLEQVRQEMKTLQSENKILSQQLIHSRPPTDGSTPELNHGKLRGLSTIAEIIPKDTSNRLQRLEQKLACISDDSNSDNLYLEGCNLHVRDGSGTTAGSGKTSNKGNLIVGYNEPARDKLSESLTAPSVCSLPGSQYNNNEPLCIRDGGTYGKSLKLGHHNIIVGAGHSYTQHSGLIVGFENALSGAASSVLSGRWNHATGAHASVLGGADNIAIGWGSVVIGGYDNIASGEDSTVVGGTYNSAMGEASSIIGGSNHESAGLASFVGGGSSNKAIGDYSSITSGYYNKAKGRLSGITSAYMSIVEGHGDSFCGGQALRLY